MSNNKTKLLKFKKLFSFSLITNFFILFCFSSQLVMANDSEPAKPELSTVLTDKDLGKLTAKNEDEVKNSSSS